MKVYVLNRSLYPFEDESFQTIKVFEKMEDALDELKDFDEESPDEFYVKEFELQTERYRYSVGDTIEFRHETNEGETTMVGLIFAYDWSSDCFIVYVDRDNDAVRVREKEIVKRIKKYKP